MFNYNTMLWYNKQKRINPLLYEQTFNTVLFNYFIFLEVSKINTTINKYWLIYLFQILIAISLMKLVVVQKDKSIVYRKYLYICVDTFKML
ncbi:hypothetical protein PFAG_04808 [Plasmodium falciparum Santa Lucia]|uniref:Uncharacterized protein n=2 Tax=Plasmodium falciparum TaxID=5833 RepID=W7F996_PLAF8|nr:hypothetical protein PFBG_04779 [Plasmodium falciparum 7G8]EUT80164.1 hypothetical protein PFAG_04808 [Plasmodium falciparum Santa Lucia]